MRNRLLVTLILAIGLAATAFASSSAPGLPADEALQLLKDGNTRFVSGQSTHPRQGQDRRQETAKGGQHPVATIVGCSDSREPLELIFDQGVGDLFVVRVAGNVSGADELGSVEYGVGHLGTTLIVVLGHTSCGAVTAAVQNAKVGGNIPALINQIKPAVAKAKAWNPTASGEDLLNKAIKANVWLSMENMLRKSHEVREYVKDGKAMLVGGIYDLASGQVTWLGQHPDQGKILAQAEHPKAVHKPVAKPEAKAEDKAEAKSESKPESKEAAHGAAKPAAKQSITLEDKPGSMIPPAAPEGKQAPAHP